RHRQMCIIYSNLNNISTDNLEKINELAAYAREKGYRFYGLTASNSDVVKQLTDLHHIPYEFCSMDEIQLKTIVRSNPGLVLLKKGTVIDKWGHRDIPGIEILKDKDPLAYCLNEQQSITKKYVVYSLTLLYLCLLFLYMIKKYRKTKA
ncbi:MAG: DoxX family protein, partial [Odoribacter sp.]|nr:DoxX family protein [Odoribacter sp.]